jgi:protein-ribulosamine 3-kinase
MMQGTFESKSMFYHYLPDHVPKPLDWGQYGEHPDTWFYLCDFNDMIDVVTEPDAFVPIIVQIHKASMGESPEGKYGFQSRYPRTSPIFPTITLGRAHGRFGSHRP